MTTNQNANVVPQQTGRITDSDGDPLDMGGATDLDSLVALSVGQTQKPNPNEIKVDDGVSQEKPGSVLEDLQKRLGVKLEDLVSQKSSEQPQSDEQGDSSDADSNSEEGDASGSNKEETSESFQWEAFETAFKDKTGVDLAQAIETINTLSERFAQMESQYNQATQLAELQTKWGVDDSEFQQRLAAIGEFSQTLSPEMIEKLDNVDGAMLLWARIEQQQQQSKSPATSLKAPSILGGSKIQVNQRQSPSIIPASRFLGETPEQKQYYFENSDAIADAINKGLVDWNS